MKTYFISSIIFVYSRIQIFANKFDRQKITNNINNTTYEKKFPYNFVGWSSDVISVDSVKQPFRASLDANLSK